MEFEEFIESSKQENDEFRKRLLNTKISEEEIDSKMKFYRKSNRILNTIQRCALTKMRGCDDQKLKDLQNELNDLRKKEGFEEYEYPFLKK
jgi:hypothetical protein